METQRGRHHEKFIKAFEKCRLTWRGCLLSQLFLDYIPPIHYSHTAREESRIKAIKLTEVLLKCVIHQEEQVQVQVPATSEPAEGAMHSSHFHAREASSSQEQRRGCNATSHWLNLRSGCVKAAVIGRLRVGGAARGVSLI